MPRLYGPGAVRPGRLGALPDATDADRAPDEHTRTYIMVDGITETLERIRDAGGQVLTPRTAIGPGMGAFAIFADPVGNEFGLYEEPEP